MTRSSYLLKENLIRQRPKPNDLRFLIKRTQVLIEVKAQFGPRDTRRRVSACLFLKDR